MMGFQEEDTQAPTGFTSLFFCLFGIWLLLCLITQVLNCLRGEEPQLKTEWSA